ncbi:LysE family transporter [Ensifer adhaerens]|uniref:LysE family transporter n=1 Tax=Ensifer adhaerens TaxID=106592 RepID=UPI000CF1962E|nr:LysE family transporter [Ensifer adhaerens]
MTELLAVITITIFAVISPGPDFAMVTRNSLLLSRRAGVLTAIGIAFGVWVHVAYTLLGVGLLIRQSLLLFTVLKLVGAAYLIWLGISMLRAKPAKAAASTERVALSGLAALRMGFLTNALNPKTTIFVVSLFMQVVQPTTALSVQMAYGAFISAAHLIWFAIVALFFSSPTVRLRLLTFRHWIDRAFGALLVGFGALLAAASVTR